MTFEVEKPQEPIEDVPAAKIEEAESLEAVVNNSETPLEIVQDEPIEVEEKVEEPIEESPAPASAPQELVMAEEPLAAVAEPVLEQPEPVQVEAEGKNIFKFQTKINFDEKTTDIKIPTILKKELDKFKVTTLSEGHKILKNLPLVLTFL